MHTMPRRATPYENSRPTGHRLRPLLLVAATLALPWALIACSAPDEPSAPMSVADGAMAAGETSAETVPARSAAAAQRKLIRTADLTLTVDDTEGAADRAQRITSAFGGFVSDLDSWTSGEARVYRITLRVPVDQLEPLMDALRGLGGRVEKETLRTQDVTDQYVDLEARLVTLEATEEELRELLEASRDQGQNVERIMAVYRQLIEIRTEAERIEAQLRSLGQRASLSTVHLHLHPADSANPVVDDRWQPGTTLRANLRTLVKIVQGLIDWGLGLVIVVIPTLLLIALPIWLLFRVWRRVRPKKAPSIDPDEVTLEVE